MKKNSTLRIILLILSFFLFLIISQKLEKYLIQNNFIKIFILIFIFINFFTGSILKKFTKLSIIIFFYFFIIIYSLNAIMTIYDHKNSVHRKKIQALNDKKILYDKKNLIEKVKFERSKGNYVYPYVVPREFLTKTNFKEKVLIPMPNTKYIACNEYGKWKTIKTDSLGFNNSKYLREVDILFIGDSFSEGACVDKEYEPVSLFEKKTHKKAYNVGVSGNGPLLSLAIAHEIKNKIEFNKLVWLIFDNDFYDLKFENNKNSLNEYLKNDYLSSNYFVKLNEKKEYQRNFIENNLNSFSKDYSLYKNFFELKTLLPKLNYIITKKYSHSEIQYEDEKEIFLKTFTKIKYIYPNKEIYIIYLPETNCFNLRKEDCKKRAGILKSASKNVKFYNFFEYIQKNQKNYKNFYALGVERMHFSPEGYELLVNFIINKIY